jgi:hypothetical protein
MNTDHFFSDTLFSDTLFSDTLFSDTIAIAALMSQCQTPGLQRAPYSQ